MYLSMTAEPLIVALIAKMTVTAPWGKDARIRPWPIAFVRWAFLEGNINQDLVLFVLDLHGLTLPRRAAIGRPIRTAERLKDQIVECLSGIVHQNIIIKKANYL